jgi:hypothetical protein
MEHETIDAWTACVSRLAAPGAPVVRAWPDAGRRQIRFDAPARRPGAAEGPCYTSDKQVLDLVAAVGPVTTLQLSLELGCSVTTAYKRLRRLRDNGALAEALGT